MDFKQIEAFESVARYKSFSKAADAAFLSQPTISIHIKTLEDELGFQLLDRNRRKVKLTAYGEEFYKYAVNMLEARANAVAHLNNLQQKPIGVLNLITSGIPARSFVPEAINGFSRENEEVKFCVEESDSAYVVEALKEGRANIGFLGYKYDEELTYREVMEDAPVLIAREDWKSSEVETVSISDMMSERFIWREEGSATRKAFENRLVQGGIDVEAMDVVARIDNIEVIKKCVAQGLGISILSKTIVDEGDMLEGIKSFSMAEFENRRKFYMVTKKNILLSPVEEAFVSFVERMVSGD